MDFHVVSRFLVLSSPDLTFTIPLPDLQTHWPLQALREISTGKQGKNKIRKSLSCSAENSKQESHSSGDKGVWCTNSTFVPSGRQESSDTSSQARVTSHCLSPLLPESDPEHRPDTNAQPHSHMHKCRLLNRLKFLWAPMTLEQDVMVPSQRAQTRRPDGSPERMYAEQGASTVPQSCPPPRLQPYRHICPRPQASCLTFNYNNVRLCHDSVLWAKLESVCGSLDQQLVSQSQHSTDPSRSAC